MMLTGQLKRINMKNKIILLIIFFSILSIVLGFIISNHSKTLVYYIWRISNDTTIETDKILLEVPKYWIIFKHKDTPNTKNSFTLMYSKYSDNFCWMMFDETDIVKREKRFKNRKVIKSFFKRYFKEAITPLLQLDNNNSIESITDIDEISSSFFGYNSRTILIEWKFNNQNYITNFILVFDLDLYLESHCLIDKKQKPNVIIDKIKLKINQR